MLLSTIRKLRWKQHKIFFTRRSDLLKDCPSPLLGILKLLKDFGLKSRPRKDIIFNAFVLDTKYLYFPTKIFR